MSHYRYLRLIFSRSLSFGIVDVCELRIFFTVGSMYWYPEDVVLLLWCLLWPDCELYASLFLFAFLFDHFRYFLPIYSYWLSVYRVSVLFELVLLLSIMIKGYSFLN